MSWSTLNFPKHFGKTLPQVLFSDPDWFFWAINGGGFKGALKTEAFEILKKATAIRIPQSSDEDLVAEYVIHPPTGKFGGLKIVPRATFQSDDGTFRRDVIDLSVPRQIARYDKRGNNILIRSAKLCPFGNRSFKMTKGRCEEFFEDDANFVMEQPPVEQEELPEDETASMFD